MPPRLYRAILRLMPSDFRSEYGEEMCAVACEHRRAEAIRSGSIRSLLFWTRQSIAVIREALRFRREALSPIGEATMEGFLHDLKQAVRSLIRRPGFSLVTVATLAIGIGSTTTIFSAVHAVLLRPLPYDDNDRIAVIRQYAVDSGELDEGVSAANIRDLSSNVGGVSSVAVAEPWSLDLQVDGRSESLRTWAVSAGFFDAIGPLDVTGRTFTAEETEDDGAPVVVVSHSLWQNRFGSDPDLVGSVIPFEEGSMTVVGILPENFRFPDAADVWMPRTVQPRDQFSRSASYMVGVTRLEEGRSLDQVQEEFDRVAASLAQSFPDSNEGIGFRLIPLRTHLFGDVRTPLLIIMGAVTLVLLIACANVAGLMLARGVEREREYALRGALGAGTTRLISHVTAESIVLATVGCLVGVGIALFGVELIRSLGPDHLPRIDQLQVDGAVLAFAGGASALAALLAGLVPSLRLSRPDLRSSMSDGTRGSGERPGGKRMRGRLVIVEIAAAVILLVGAGLLVRSFVVLLDNDLGFDPSNRLAVQLFAYDGYAAADSLGLTRGAFVNQVVDNVEAIPGVTGVALTTSLPGANDGIVANIDVTSAFVLPDRPELDAGAMVWISQTSPRYFDVVGMQVIGGRGFESTDDGNAAPVAIVNQAWARRFFADGDPIGRDIILTDFTGDDATWRIVGVVSDTRPLGHASDPRPEVFLPLNQVPSGSLTFVVRTERDVEAFTQPVMEAIWAVNPSQSLWGATTLESLMSEWLKERRFSLFLLGTFSILALVLSAIGVYGLISYSVQRRLGEMGLRRALGGESADILKMVLVEGIKLAGVGIAIGLVAALYLSRFIRGMLFDIEPYDPATFAVLAAAVLLIAVSATLIPALRAIRVDPMTCLRGLE